MPLFRALLLTLVAALSSPVAAQVEFDLAAVSLASTDTQNPTFFIATPSGLFTSPGNFDHLEQVYIRPAGMTQPLLTQVFVDGSSVYARAFDDEREIWVSHDVGQTWALATNGLRPDTDIIQLDITNNGNLYALLRDGVSSWVYVSTNRGQSWTLAGSLPTNSDEFAVNASQPDLMYTTAGRIFYRSTDGGQTWTSRSTLPFAVSQVNGTAFIVADPANPMNVLMGGGGGSFGGGLQNGVYHSTDQGGNFELTLLTVAAGIIAGPDWPYYFHRNSTALGEIDLTYDRGVTWQRNVRFSENRNTFPLSALPDPRNNQIVFIGGSANGDHIFFRSASSGADWQPLTATADPTIGGPETPLVVELPKNTPARTARLDIRSVESSTWPLDYTVDDPMVPWLTLNSTTGVTGSEADGVSLSVDPSGLEIGEYTAQLTVNAPASNNGQVSVPVTLRVTAELTGPQPIITTFAGNGNPGPDGIGGPASQAALPSLSKMALGPDGSIYLASRIEDKIYRITPAGVFEDFAGTGEGGYSGDGGPASEATFDFPESVAVAPDGTVYVLDGFNRRTRKISPQGVITTVTGDGEFSSTNRPEEAGPDATAVSLDPDAIAVNSAGILHVVSSIYVYRINPDGSYIRIGRKPSGLVEDYEIASNGANFMSTGGDQVYRVVGNSTPTLIAGSGATGYTGDGGPATMATLDGPEGIAFGDNGMLFIADRDNAAIRVVDNSGTIQTIAGNGADGFSGDGGPALFAGLDGPTDLIYRDNRLYILDAGNRRIRVINFPSAQSPQLTSSGVVNAGSFALNNIAPGENISIFGANLANQTVVATQTPLPQEMAGTRVSITDSAGATYPCVLFFVTGTQVNCNVNDATATGPANMAITTPTGAGSAPVQVTSTAPGLFAANANGQGVAAAIAIRVAGDGTQTPVDIINTGAQPFTGLPIDLGPESDQVVLLLYGTGIRNWRNVQVTIGGVEAAVIGIAEQGQFVGLDQVNVIIPRSLIGAGEVDVQLTIDGQVANTVTINIQ